MYHWILRSFSYRCNSYKVGRIDMTHQICENSYASKNVAWFEITSQF